MFRVKVFSPKSRMLCAYSHPCGLVEASLVARAWTEKGYPTEIVLNTRASQREHAQFRLAATSVYMHSPITGAVISQAPWHPPDAECQGK